MAQIEFYKQWYPWYHYVYQDPDILAALSKLDSASVSLFYTRFRFHQDFIVHVEGGVPRGPRGDGRPPGLSMPEILPNPTIAGPGTVHAFGDDGQVTRCIPQWVNPNDCHEIRNVVAGKPVRMNLFTSKIAHDQGEQATGKLFNPLTVELLLTGPTPAGLRRFTDFLHWLAAQFGPHYKCFLQPVSVMKGGGEVWSISTNVIHNQTYNTESISKHADYTAEDLGRYHYIPSPTFEIVGRTIVMYINLREEPIGEDHCSTLVHSESGRTMSCPFSNGGITYLDGSVYHSLQSGICHRISFVYKILILKLTEDAPPIQEKERRIFEHTQPLLPRIRQRRHSSPLRSGVVHRVVTGVGR
jgi:hypothetical protein